MSTELLIEVPMAEFTATVTNYGTLELTAEATWENDRVSGYLEKGQARLLAQFLLDWANS